MHSTVCFPPFHLHVQTSGQSARARPPRPPRTMIIEAPIRRRLHDFGKNSNIYKDEQNCAFSNLVSKLLTQQNFALKFSNRFVKPNSIQGRILCGP